MKKGKVTGLFFRFTSKFVTLFKIIAPILLVLLLLASLVTPLNAQLSPARDLTGTWQSSATAIYYDLDPTDPNLRMNDITTKFAMDITQQGNQITIVLHLKPISYVTDNAYWQEYGFGGVPPILDAMQFKGTVSSSSFDAVEQYTSFSPEHLVGTFTSDIITATLSGDSWTTDTNRIVVTRTSSPTSTPTQSPTSTPTLTPATALPTADNLGSVSLIRAPAWFKNNGASLITAQSPIGTGVEVQTGSDGIIGFSYPDQGGTVYLGANSVAAWVYLQPQTTPTGKTQYSVVPPPAGSIPFETGLEADELGQVAVTLPIEIGVAVLLVGETLPATLAAAMVVEGVLLLPTGIAYIKENLSPQPGTCDMKAVQVPQGLIVGRGTEYVVTVNNSTMTIQVIAGSVIFIDQYTQDAITLVTSQKLTLPSAVQSGFSQQTLLSDVTAFNSASLNQWWTQAQPNVSNGSPNFLFQLIPVVAVFVLIISVLTFARRRKKRSKISQLQETYLPPPPPPA